MKQFESRDEWTSTEWLEYLEGWCFQRLGYPRFLLAGTQRSWSHSLGIVDAARCEPS